MTKLIRNLALAGGGVYGFAHIGVLKQLEQYPEQIKIDTIRGVSVGGMIAAMYAVGYTADELLEIMTCLEFGGLVKDSFFNVYRLYEKFGLYDAAKLQNEIERYISMKTHIKLCQFCQIKCNLTIVVTNLNRQQPVLLNRETAPNMPISLAVRMSISYPLVITPVMYEGELYGDGGECINYPITTFDDKEIDVSLGVTFARFNENRDGTLSRGCTISNLTDYILAIAYTLSRSAYVAQLQSRHLERSIVVHVDRNIDVMKIGLEPADKIYLYQCGITAANQQLPAILGLSV